MSGENLPLDLVKLAAENQTKIVDAINLQLDSLSRENFKDPSLRLPVNNDPSTGTVLDRQDLIKLTVEYTFSNPFPIDYLFRSDLEPIDKKLIKRLEPGEPYGEAELFIEVIVTASIIYNETTNVVEDLKIEKIQITNEQLNF